MNQEQRKQAERLLEWLHSQRKADGWTVDWINTVAWKELMYLVNEPSSTSQLSHGQTMTLVGEMVKQGDSSLDCFEALRKEREEEWHSDQAENSRIWTFLLPLQVELETGFSGEFGLRVLGQDFQVISSSRALELTNEKALASLEDLDYLFRKTGFEHDALPSCFIQTSGRGLTSELAWETVRVEFDTLRGVFELTHNLYGWRNQWIKSGRSDARRKFAHPLWIACYSDGLEPEIGPFSVDESISQKQPELSMVALKTIEANAAVIREKATKGSIYDLIGACLRLYANAMDAKANRFALLGFWQLAEAIACYDKESGKAADVANRLAWHDRGGVFKASGYRASLKGIAEKRHRFVHEGVDLVDDDDINILKLACETALTSLINLSDRLPTMSHLRKLYQLQSLSNRDLDAIQDIAAFVRTQRSSPD